MDNLSIKYSVFEGTINTIHFIRLADGQNAR